MKKITGCDIEKALEEKETLYLAKYKRHGEYTEPKAVDGETAKRKLEVTAPNGCHPYAVFVSDAFLRSWEACHY